MNGSPRLLLLSNSMNYRQGYLEHASPHIQSFLGSAVTRVLFVPYARVLPSLEEYYLLVAEVFRRIGYEVDSVHRVTDAAAAVEKAEAIAVGGGNTFHLLKTLYSIGLIDLIRDRVQAGVPYIGWSAGSNVACPTIRTTNDMPIVEPPSLNALGLVPFQINPHYTEFHVPEHQGETRAQRIAEFIEINPDVSVVAMPEGALLRVEGRSIQLLGSRSAKVFRNNQAVGEYEPNQSLEFLFQ